MASLMENPAVSTRGDPEVSLAASKMDPETNLEALRKQFLSEVFALPACTAAVIAELAFPEAPHA